MHEHRITPRRCLGQIFVVPRLRAILAAFNLSNKVDAGEKSNIEISFLGKGLEILTHYPLNSLVCPVSDIVKSVIFCGESKIEIIVDLATPIARRDRKEKRSSAFIVCARAHVHKYNIFFVPLLSTGTHFSIAHTTLLYLTFSG